jgi:hypothetical protein
MPYPHSVVLFHDTTGTRDGDAERAKLPPPLGSESRSRSESAK